MNEAGLQDLKTAVNMKPGHLAALRATIGREAPAGAPLREAEAQATAPAAPAPEPTLAPAARPVQHPYVPAAGLRAMQSQPWPSSDKRHDLE